MAPLLNQIQTWMKLPKVWRFVGFASALVGLLCFALSSSFNSLFGEWNLWKTFLYSVFSFIICTAVLFAKAWRRSSSLPFKAHMAVLVLTVTSFYSSFFDKHANGKPDAYSLVSCAAFAVMSLSLSRQTHCGFEVDLLYFFLGALIIQLTKIELPLGIVGAVFSYFLIILRSSLEAQAEANGYSDLQDQAQVDIQVGSLHLLASIGALKKKNPILIGLICRAQDLGEPFQLDHNEFIDALPSEIIDNLNEAMKISVAAGFEEESCHLYSGCRKEFLRQCLLALNFQGFFNNENDNVAEGKERIWNWIIASKIAIKYLFPNERRLCDRVFFELSSVGDRSFAQICTEPTVGLMNFAKTLSVEPKILKETLQVFMTLRDIIPELESLFLDQDGVSLSNEAITTHKRLGDAIRDIFKYMENLIRCDTRIADVPGGIYPITHHIMECLHQVIKVKPIIEKVWEEYPMVSNTRESSPSFLVQTAWIMELLESHLEARSKNYTEPALCYVSMLNNAMHIKERIQLIQWRLRRTRKNEDNGERFGLDPIFCEDQIQKHTSKVQQNLEDYRRSSWNEVLALLKLENKEESVAPGVAAESMKDKLQLFNIQFEQICNIQSKWFASHSMRMKIINAQENMLLPAYGNFIGRFHDVLGKHAYEYIQYGMLDIKARLNRTFLGAASE